MELGWSQDGVRMELGWSQDGVRMERHRPLRPRAARPHDRTGAALPRQWAPPVGATSGPGAPSGLGGASRVRPPRRPGGWRACLGSPGWRAAALPRDRPQPGRPASTGFGASAISRSSALVEGGIGTGSERSAAAKSAVAANGGAPPRSAPRTPLCAPPCVGSVRTCASADLIQVGVSEGAAALQLSPALVCRCGSACSADLIHVGVSDGSTSALPPPSPLDSSCCCCCGEGSSSMCAGTPLARRAATSSSRERR